MYILNIANYCISRRRRLLGETTKQPLSNFEPRKPWKCKQLSGLTLVTYKKTKCIRKLQVKTQENKTEKIELGMKIALFF